METQKHDDAKPRIYDPKLHLIVLALVFIAETIRQRQFPIGPGNILLLPMLYSLIMGMFLGPKFLKIVSLEQMQAASPLISVSIMLLIARLGTIVGPSLKSIASAGLPLLAQEFGNLGTSLIALPVALLLGLDREAVGASFSICREGSLAIIDDRYGLDSPEGRGSLGTYITGTIFGTVFMGILGGTVASLGLFHPWAVGMASGVGSASLMSASAGSVAAALPEASQDILAFAAASNLLTISTGMYMEIFVSLPLTNWLYWKWRKIIVKKASQQES